MSTFTVSGRLELTGGGGFTQEARQAEAALRGVGAASGQLNSQAQQASAALERERAGLRATSAIVTTFGTDLRYAAQCQAQLNATAVKVATAIDQETAALGRATAAAKAKAEADRKAREQAEQAAKPPPASTLPSSTPPATPKPQPGAPARAPLTSQQTAALFYQGSDVAAQLAGGQNPLLIAIQQGPQLMQAFGNSFRGMASGIMSGLRAIPPHAAAVVLAIGAVTAPLTIGVSHAQQLNRELRQTDITLRATAQSAGLTARAIQMAVEAELGRPGAGRDETFLSANRLQANPLLSGDLFTRTLATARDFARVTSAELPQAADVLAGAFDGTAASIQKLDQVFRFLTVAELEQIRAFEETGRKSDVVRIALGALERQFQSLNERGASSAEKGTAALRASWEQLKSSMSDGWFIQRLTRGLEHFWETAKFAARGVLDLASGSGGAPAADPVAAAKQQAAAAAAAHDEIARQLTDLQRRRDAAAQGGQQYWLDAEIRATRSKLARAQDDVQRHAAIVQKAEADAAKARDQGAAAAQAAADKEALAAAHRAGTAENRRKAIDAEIAQQERLLRNTQITAQTRASIEQQLEKLRGERATLETPAQQIEREAREAARLAAMPQHLRAAEQAYQTEYRRALAATGDAVRATAAAEKARATALLEQHTATREQVDALDDEAVAALQVAAAYGRSTAEALKLKAALAARAAEDRGEIASGTAGRIATAQLERDAAAAVESAAQRVDAARQEADALQRVADAERVSSEAAREAARANDVATFSHQLMAQAIASGSPRIVAAAREQIAAYDEVTRRRLAADRQREAAQLNRQYDPDAAFADSMARLQALKETGMLTARAVAEATKEYELQRLEASRSSTDGMIAGLRRYADEAANFGRAAADGIAQGLRAGEDALVSFVTKGKFSFSSLADSILADMARIAIRQGITGPLSQGLGWVLNRVFGGGGGNPTSVEGSASDGQAATGNGVGGGFFSFIGDLIGRIFHEGGVVGEGGRRSGPLPAALWAGARRYHGGGPVLGPGEVPIIAMRGEEVLPANHPRHRDNAGRAGPAVVVNVINNGGARVQTRERENGDGSLTIDVLIDAVETGMARNVAAGRGALHAAITSSFDIDDRGRR